MLQLMRFIGILLGIVLVMFISVMVGIHTGISDSVAGEEGTIGWYVGVGFMGLLITFCAVVVVVSVGVGLYVMWKSCARDDEPSLWKSITDKTNNCIRYFKLKLVERGVKKNISNNSKYENLIEAQELENKTLKERKLLTEKYHTLVGEGNTLRESLG